MKSKEFKIDNYTYQIEEFFATKRMTLQFKFGGLFAKIYGELLSTEGLEDADIQTKVFNVIAEIDPLKTSEMVKELVQSAVMIPPNLEDDVFFDKHFKENYHHLIPLSIEAFNLNYGRSISELKKKLPLIGNVFPRSSETVFNEN